MNRWMNERNNEWIKMNDWMTEKERTKINQWMYELKLINECMNKMNWWVNENVWMIERKLMN